MAQRILLVAVLGLWLSQSAAVRAQLTNEEVKLFNQLLAEPDGMPAYEKRLRLIESVLEREGDPTRRPAGALPVDLKRARIPASLGVPFLLGRLDHPSEIVKRVVLRMIAAYGVEGKPAVPTVLDVLKQDPVRTVRADAMKTLARIEPTNAAAAAAILERLDADEADDATCREALAALAAMAAVVPKAAAPRMARFQERRPTDIGVQAYELIGKILALKRPTLEQLRTMTAIEWRKTPDQGYAILAAIGDAGSNADFAAPLLLGMLDSAPPPYLELAALETLTRLRTGNPQAIAAILDRIQAKDLAIRTKARTALQVIDLKQPASVRALAAGLRHADRGVRFDVAVTLRSWDETNRLPPAAHAALLEPLLQTLAEVDDSVSPAHLEAYLMLLRRFGPRAAAAAEGLGKLHQSDAYFKKYGFGSSVRGKLLAALANIGVSASAHEPIMQVLRKGPALQPDDGYSYAAAARAVATYSQSKEVVPLLLPGLAATGIERPLYFIDWSGDGPGKPTTLRVETIRALGKIGPAAEEALPLLREIVDRQTDRSTDLDLLAATEARRAYQAIAGKPLPPRPGLFADGKKDRLHLDDRLQVKITLKLRNPRPADVCKRLEQATNLKFMIDESINPDIPVWGQFSSTKCRPGCACARWPRPSASRGPGKTSATAIAWRLRKRLPARIRPRRPRRRSRRSGTIRLT